VLAFAVMVSVLLAESYNDRVHVGGGDRILLEEWSLIVLPFSACPYMPSCMVLQHPPSHAQT
jgi:hypothetical protein